MTAAFLLTHQDELVEAIALSMSGGMIVTSTGHKSFVSRAVADDLAGIVLAALRTVMLGDSE